jgi:hypothetical protein
MPELKSLLDDLLTLKSIAQRSGGDAPAEVVGAIEAVVKVLAETEFVKPSSVAAVLSDVEALLGAIDKLEADPEVKQFATQIVQLIANIKALSKPAPFPVSIPTQS